jgi:hypothetical protein
MVGLDATFAVVGGRQDHLEVPAELQDRLGEDAVGTGGDAADPRQVVVDIRRQSGSESSLNDVHRVRCQVHVPSDTDAGHAVSSIGQSIAGVRSMPTSRSRRSATGGSAACGWVNQ